MLALDLGTPIAKDLLAERLWDGRPPTSYIATVESYVCSLRRRLGLVGGRRGPLATTHHGYLLDPEHVRVDVTSVRSLLAGDVADVTLALDLMSGELLADEPYAAWASAARESFDELLAGACTRGRAGGQRAPRVRVGGPAGPRGHPAHLLRRAAGPGADASACTPTASVPRRCRPTRPCGRRCWTSSASSPVATPRTSTSSILRGNPAERDRQTDRDEVRTLLELLRRALEGDSGVFSGLPSMAEVGQLLLARAG